VHLREGSIDDQINVLSAVQLGVIGDNVTSEFLGGTVAAERICLDDADDLAEGVVLRAEESAVNVSAASTLTDDGNS
jgi:hypothetical protein